MSVVMSGESLFKMVVTSPYYKEYSEAFRKIQEEQRKRRRYLVFLCTRILEKREDEDGD